MSKQKRAKLKVGRYGKTDTRYWEGAVLQSSYTRDGVLKAVGEFAVKLQHQSRRHTFSLGTSNRAAAAAKAKEIYLELQANGWQGALSKFHRTSPAPRALVTVGDYLAEVRAKAGGREKTMADYARALRTIVSDIFNIDGGKSKYDYRTGGREKWISKVEAVKLADLTPAKVQAWKLAFLKRAGSDALKQRKAKISVNSILRQAKCLFAPAVRKFIELPLDAGSPFDGVEFEPRQSMRYRSSMNIVSVVEAAQSELPSEQLKIFLLAVMAGLRRREIDLLEWSSFLWEQNSIRVHTTSVFAPKTDDSSGDVEVDPELMTVFRTFREAAVGSFVIQSSVPPRPGATYTHYRCDVHFTALLKWLRGQGITGERPLHQLRKEYGSAVCARHGIYAASRALRHADIGITSQHYLDRRARATAGMGHLLSLGNCK